MSPGRIKHKKLGINTSTEENYLNASMQKKMQMKTLDTHLHHSEPEKAKDF